MQKFSPYLEKILRHTNEIIFIKDTDNNILFVNEKIRDYGYDPDELVGKKYLSLLSKKHKGKRFKKIVNSKKALNYEVEFLRSDGTIVNTLASNSPVWDDDRNILFVVSTLADITSYKELEKKLVKSTYLDYLTGLYNIRYLHKRLKEEINRSKRKKEKIAIICLISIILKNTMTLMDMKAEISCLRIWEGLFVKALEVALTLDLDLAEMNF